MPIPRSSKRMTAISLIASISFLDGCTKSAQHEVSHEKHDALKDESYTITKNFVRTKIQPEIVTSIEKSLHDVSNFASYYEPQDARIDTPNGRICIDMNRGYCYAIINGQAKTGTIGDADLFALRAITTPTQLNAEPTLDSMSNQTPTIIQPPSWHNDKLTDEPTSVTKQPKGN